MKSIIIFGIAMLCSIQISFSQSFITKGTSLIGGSVNLRQTNNDNTNFSTQNQQVTFNESKTSGFTFRPTYAYAVKDNFMIGTSLLYNRSERESTFISQDFESTRNDQTDEWGVSLFMRWYYEIKNKFGAFLEPELTVSWRSIDNVSTDRNLNTEELINESGFQLNGQTQSLGLSIGFYYFINNRFVAEASLGNLSITTSQVKNKNDRDDPSFINNDSDTSTVQLNFINTLSFDQLLTINYLF